MILPGIRYAIHRFNLLTTIFDYKSLDRLIIYLDIHSPSVELPPKIRETTGIFAGFSGVLGDRF
jgi:hypothetical protein